MRAAVVLGVLLLLGGCTTASGGLIPVTGMGDVRFVSVQRVPAADRQDGFAPAGPLLKITLATDTDIAAFALAHPGPVGAQLQPCRAPGPAPVAALLYDRFGVLAADAEAAARRSAQPGAPGAYHFYLAVPARADDLCATIAAGQGRYLGMAVSQFVSNVVVVPREAIRAALR